MDVSSLCKAEFTLCILDRLPYMGFLFHMSWLSEVEDLKNIDGKSEVVPWQNANDVKQ
jgi:hypothetical protein